VQDGVNGLLVPPGDPAALRAAVLRLWHDPDECDRLGANGRRLVEQEHTLEQWTSAVWSQGAQASAVGGRGAGPAVTPTGDGPLRFPPPVRVAAQAAVLLPGVLVAVEAGYLAVLALAALVEPQLPVRTAPPRARLCVLVPAKDEERLIGRCVSSLRAQDYPPERYEVLVVADDCSDRTAERAASSGARVLERRDASRQGKGHALRWAMDHVLADGADVDAFVVVDADSVADPGLLTALGARFEAGAAAVQGEYLVLDAEQDPRAPLRAAAFLLFHLVRFGAGRRWACRAAWSATGCC
jgi:hypothetical protein